jgi:hypothetical protein
MKTYGECRYGSTHSEPRHYMEMDRRLFGPHKTKVNLSLCLTKYHVMNKYSVIDFSTFDFWLVQEVFSFTTASRPALGPTQPPIKLTPRALSPGVKRPVREAYPSLPSSADVKNVWNYTSTPPIRLHGVLLS